MNHVRDWARGAYARLPGSTRRFVGPLAGMLPTTMRYGGTFRSWQQRIARSRIDSAFALASQTAALQHVVDGARRLSPFYAARFDAAFGADASVDAILADWSRLPILTADMVSRDPRSLCTEDPDGLDITSTGGTSGHPLTFFIDRWRSPVEFAFVMSAWQRAGCTLETWRAAFRGFAIPDFPQRIIDVDHGLREVKISVFHVSDDLIPRYLEEIERRGVTCLQGYPSALALFAAGVRRLGLAPVRRIRSVVMSSERLYPHHRRLIGAVFPQAQVVPYYGLSEKCAFASEVQGQPDHYDFEPLYGLTELVDDDGQPVTEQGRNGRIISTGLLYPGMPFIRYDTGDRATLVDLPHAGNAHRLRLSHIVPRNSFEYLVTADQRLVSMLGVCGFHDEMTSVSDYQLVQTEPGRALVRLVLVPGTAHDDVLPYLRLINSKAGGSITFDFEIVGALPRTNRGKCRFIEQRIDITALELRSGVFV